MNELFNHSAKKKEAIDANDNENASENLAPTDKNEKPSNSPEGQDEATLGSAQGPLDYLNDRTSYEAAYEYTEKGFRVLPLRPDSKKPIGEWKLLKWTLYTKMILWRFSRVKISQ